MAMKRKTVEASWRARLELWATPSISPISKISDQCVNNVTNVILGSWDGDCTLRARFTRIYKVQTKVRQIKKCTWSPKSFQILTKLLKSWRQHQSLDLLWTDHGAWKTISHEKWIYGIWWTWNYMHWPCYKWSQPHWWLIQLNLLSRVW